MDNKLREELKDLTEQLLNASSVNQDTVADAKTWLKAVGTPKEDDATRTYFAALKEAIVPIDGLIAFAGSPDGAKVFGEDQAAEVKAHAEAIKKDGAKWCDCPACTIACKILEKEDQL